MNKTKHKTKTKTKTNKTYKTLHNGDEPFTLELNNNIISIYNNLFENEKYKKDIHSLILKLKYKKIFGNKASFLIYTGNKYVYVGNCIYEFNPEEIKIFKSPIRNSFVPYPYAKSENYTYLLLEKVFIPNELLDFKNDNDIYMQYYNNKKIGKKMKYKCIKTKSSWKC